ncbi:MAG TPA: DUF4252 domain-containing protein [Pyrinomonadaceae bacterium]|nr:DUF4252 domain-containing protein [Pyrinomonadaceae bacterium]
MKSLYLTSLKISATAVLLFIGAASAMAQDARIQTTQLDALSAKASQTMNVNLDERLMRMAAGMFSGKGADSAKIKELIIGLKGIYVRSLEFEKEGEYTQADLESIRTQLRNPAWSRIVDVKSRKEGSLEVYLMSSENRIGGLAVLATDAKEITVVNIVGPVDLEKLSQLEGHFGVPDLDIQVDAPKRKTSTGTKP